LTFLISNFNQSWSASQRTENKHFFNTCPFLQIGDWPIQYILGVFSCVLQCYGKTEGDMTRSLLKFFSFKQDLPTWRQFLRKHTTNDSRSHGLLSRNRHSSNFYVLKRFAHQRSCFLWQAEMLSSRRI
jgi:hypothetical protein